MHKAGLTLIVVLLTCAVARGQGPIATTEVRILPEGDLALKQRCELVVRFLTDGFAFAKAPNFPNIGVDGAVVLPPSSGMSFTERRGGDTWVGIERRYSLYPARLGEITVSALTITARVHGSGGVADVEATSEPVVCQVVAPQELIPYPDAVITSKLTLSQKYEPDVNELKVGDALKRTMTVTADGTVSMLLPILSPIEIDGLAAYPAQGVLDDREYRGRLTATRTDSATYIAQQQGFYQLPEILVRWWDPESEQLQEAQAPGLSFRVVANPFYVADQNDLTATSAAETGTGAGPRGLKNPMAIVIITLAFSGLAFASWWLRRRYGQAWCSRWALYKTSRAESERTHFIRLRRACLANDPKEAHHVLLAWLDRSVPSGCTATLEQFAREANDPKLARMLADLNARLFGRQQPDGSWSGRELLGPVSRVRREWLRQASGWIRSRKDLAPLNPAH